MPHRLLPALVLGALALAPMPSRAGDGAPAEVAPVAAPYELVMVEQAGCAWCRRWNEEVAPEYPKTDEGRLAPLRRIDLHAPVPDDLALDTPPRLTPTFILVRDGAELGRIEGYPGEDFFWPLLGVLLERASSADARSDR